MKKKISLGLTINLMFMAIIVPMLIIALAGYIVSNNATNAGGKLYTSYGKTQGDGAMAFAYLQEAKVQLRNVIFTYADDKTKQQNSVDALAKTKENMEAFVEKASNALLDNECKKLLQESEENALAYYDVADKCVNYALAGNTESAVSGLLNEAVPSANEAQAKMEELLDTLDKKANQEEKAVEAQALTGTIIIVVLVLVGIAVAVFAIIYMNRKIKDIIVEIANDAEKLGRGNIDIELPRDNSIKEIYELIKSFHALATNLQKQADALDKLSNGDLRVDFIPASEEDVVGNAIVKLVNDDNRSFMSIRNATNQISLGSSQIAAASQTLAQGSTEQASAIEQITASITDIANKTKDNAQQADEVNRIVIDAKADVSEGNARMEEMVTAMNEINEASENIQKIIKVIDDIAFNTNILALNATVEAARAGEQGRGFAVVAEEVRNLAGRSAEASSQTAEMIEDAIQKAKRGGQLAKQTEESLQVISDMIEQITGLSEDIAKASNDQATATAQIDQALTQVSQVVQTNSATSQECASASEELSGQARGLNQELAKFQLKDIIGNMPSQSIGYEETPMLGETDTYRY